MQNLSLETNSPLSAQHTDVDFQEQNNLLVNPRVKIPVINSVCKTCGQISQIQQCYLILVNFLKSA